MKFSRLSTYKVNKIVLCFSEDITATAAAKIVKVNRNTINSYYKFVREKIVQKAIVEAGKECGEFEVDESYFGARRVRGKRGRGAAGKTPVFGLLKRDGKVFVKIVENCTK
ncbi:MAG: transposase, partial [Treponemataceae bacterium]